jgi:hypothetical protein
MPNYKQTTIDGTSWQRAHSVTVTNPLNGTPRIEFGEERVIVLAGEMINQWAAGCSKDFSPTGDFPLLNPETNAPLGASMTHTDLYVALYSLYMQTVAERDVAALVSP